jgi:hypothetical protein
MLTQKVVRDFNSLNEAANEVFRLRSNAGYLTLTRDSITYRSKNKKSGILFDFRLSYCEIVTLEKYSLWWFISKQN